MEESLKCREIRKNGPLPISGSLSRQRVWVETGSLGHAHDTAWACVEGVRARLAARATELPSSMSQHGPFVSRQGP